MHYSYHLLETCSMNDFTLTTFHSTHRKDVILTVCRRLLEGIVAMEVLYFQNQIEEHRIGLEKALVQVQGKSLICLCLELG